MADQGSMSLACVSMIQSHALFDEHCIEAREDDFIGSDEGTPRSGGLMRIQQEVGRFITSLGHTCLDSPDNMMTRRMSV